MDESNLDKLDLQNQALASKEELKGMYLTFWTDGQLFGVPISDVEQIIGMMPVTEIPDAQAYQIGIINVRGNIIPLIDVRLRFGKPAIEYNDRACIIISSIRGLQIGFIVDEVNEVTSIDEGSISPPPWNSDGESKNAYLTGVGKQDGNIVLLLDTAKLLSDDIINSIAKQIQVG